MDSRRWQKIEQLYYAALELEPTRRGAFLAEACEGDAVLEREVESLLRADNQASRFLEKTALEAAAQRVAESQADSALQQSSETEARLMGRSISHYRVLEKLGSGGMGVVYKAEDIRLGRRVALKFLPEELARDPVALQRFEREARAASALEHANICPIYEFGEHEGQPFIVMQLLHGQTLRERIAQVPTLERLSPEANSDGTLNSPFGTTELLDVAIQIADGLEAAHHKGIIHRDIKPGNIFVTNRGEVKILDFGVAKLIDFNEEVRDGNSDQIGRESRQQGLSTPVVSNPHLTRTGTPMGTAGYMSPEQALGHELDARTDLFSFGAVLYEMVCGQKAFQGDSKLSTLAAIAKDEPKPIGQVVSGIPPELERLINRCLRKDPARRFHHMKDVKNELEALKEELASGKLAGTRPAIRPAWRRFPHAKRDRIELGTITLTLLLALAMLVWLLNRSQHQKDMERIRLTLQKIIMSKDGKPENLQPDWQDLQALIKNEVRRKPEGELAVLVQRAAIRTTVELSSFGLLSKMPEIWVGGTSVLDPAKDFLIVISFEGTLDAGPWRSIRSFLFVRDEQHPFGYFSWRNSERLGEIFPEERFTVTAPHQLELRATLKFFDPRRLSAEARKEFPIHGNVRPLRVGSVLESSIPFFTEVRSMGTTSIALFREYPEDFPHKISRTGSPDPFASSFHVDRIRILRVDLPEGNASAFSIDWPDPPNEFGDHSRGQSYFAPVNRANLKGLVVAIELFGRIDSQMPIASEATLWSDPDSKQLLTFPFVFGLSEMCEPLENSAISYYTGDSTSRLTYEFGKNSGSFPIFRETTQDMVTSGHFNLIPSRAVALATRCLDRYWGEKVSIRVPRLEIITVQGKWSNVPPFIH
jgi:serine/threonine protein kinase